MKKLIILFIAVLVIMVIPNVLADPNVTFIQYNLTCPACPTQSYNLSCPQDIVTCPACPVAPTCPTLTCPETPACPVCPALPEIPQCPITQCPAINVWNQDFNDKALKPFFIFVSIIALIILAVQHFQKNPESFRRIIQRQQLPLPLPQQQYQDVINMQPAMNVAMPPQALPTQYPQPQQMPQYQQQQSQIQPPQQPIPPSNAIIPQKKNVFENFGRGGKGGGGS